MRVPLNWLREHCDPPLSTTELADRLTMTGTKVEAVHAHGVGDPAGFVVGKILAAGPHADADRLSVCTVDVGDRAPLQIVCGAPNVAAGQTVGVARPGAVLPGGVVLRAARLRGVISEGMILAEDELAIGADHAGILVLGENGGALPGTPLIDVLPIATDVLELEVTPNRPDCLAIYGVAREVHAVTGAALGRPPWVTEPLAPGPQGPDAVPAIRVTVADPEICPRFTARLFEGVALAPSPPWLKARLTAAGQRPISNVVDITNYVMLLTGQPMHAFDADRVAGATLEVRRAGVGETLETLDGARRELDPSMIAIADADGVTSLAGVMGGARSEVSTATTRVVMEAATWDGPILQRTAAALGLRSEASARFEKGLAPETTIDAQAVASRLMVELCGARPLAGTVDVGGPPPAPTPIRLRDIAVSRLLGAPVPRPRAREILEALEFSVDEAPDGLDATPPAFRRADVTREADLIEEVARVDGLDRLPETLPSARGTRGGLSRAQALRRQVEDALTGRGVHETLGWSFAPADHDDRLGLPAEDPRRVGHVRVANPMVADQGGLRTALLGSLLDAAGRNQARGQHELRLFEAASVYAAPTAEVASAERLPLERRHLAVLLTGRARPLTWRDPQPPEADLFAVKGLLAALMEQLRVDWALEACPEPFLHPGRSARIFAGPRRLGWLGELHPRVATAWDLDRVAAFELDLDALIELAVASAVPVYRDLPSFPAVSEDLAVVVDDDVTAARVLEVVRAAAGPTLELAEIFDVYRGAQVGEGKVSLAMSLTFRSAQATLTDAEVAERRAEIVEAVRSKLGGRPRG